MPTPSEPTSLPSLPRDTVPPLAEEEWGTLFDEIAVQTVDREPNWRDRLRELPTPTRTLVTVGISLASAVAVVTLGGVRSGMTDAQTTALVFGCAVMVLMGVVAASLSLRGTYQARLPVVAAAAGLLLAYPVFDALFHPLGLPGFDTPVPWSAHATCGLGSLIPAAITGVLLTVFDRDDEPALWRIAAAAGAGGLIGYAAQAAHCPALHPVHLLVGHASAGLLVGIGLVVAHRLRRV